LRQVACWITGLALSLKEAACAAAAFPEVVATTPMVVQTSRKTEFNPHSAPLRRLLLHRSAGKNYGEIPVIRRKQATPGDDPALGDWELPAGASLKKELRKAIDAGANPCYTRASSLI
jgi:hypothetical protein